MKRSSLALSLFLLVCAACDAGSASDHESLAEANVAIGTLQMALTGSDAQHQEYRLRAATFDIRGTPFEDPEPVTVTLSSESEPDAAHLRTRLLYGYYDVSLRDDGWYLERLTPEGPERIEQAVLLSTRTQYAYVQEGVVSPVAFQFGVGGRLVDFRGGALEIGVGVQTPPDAGF
jgi:hypothetical protein